MPTPDNSPLIQPGDTSFQDAAQALMTSSAPPEAVTNIIVSVSTILNSFIGLTITITIILFFVYLLMWIMWRDQEKRSRAAETATRAFIALFLEINVWVLIRLINIFAGLSDAAAYGIVLALFLIFCLWSLFGIGKALVVMLGRTTDFLIENVLAFVGKHLGQTYQLNTMSHVALRLLVLFAIFGVITLLNVLLF